MDKYKKIKIIGKGSFGYAVLVESRKNRKQFIIKVSLEIFRSLIYQKWMISKFIKL